MRLKIISITAILLASLIVSAAAPVTKIAVVDVEKVFNEFYKTKIVQSQLEEQQNVYRTHSANMNKKYTELQEEYKILLDAAQNVTLKESERQEKSRDAAKKMMERKQLEAEIEQYLTEKGRQFKQLEESKRIEITNEIMAEIQRRATIDDLDMVIDYSGRTSSNMGSVVFFKANLDITTKVLEELNRGNLAAQKNLNKGK